jgi:hypothetical protein
MEGQRLEVAIGSMRLEWQVEELLSRSTDLKRVGGQLRPSLPRHVSRLDHGVNSPSPDQIYCRLLWA